MPQRCPYCGTSLEDATDEIRPGVRLCPTCGQEIEMASQAAPPPPPPPQGQAGVPTGTQAPTGPTEHTPAWELDGGFWLQKLWRTIWQVLLHPMLTFWAPGRMRQQYPLAFGLIIGTLGSVLGVFWDSLLKSGQAAVISPVLMVFIAPFGIILGLYLGAAIMHLFLMMVGAAKGGYTATFRVTGYSYAGYIFMVVPVVGGVVAAVWMIVVQIGGLAATHGTTRWRVVAAILIFIGVIVAIILAGALLVGCGAFLAQMGLEGGASN
jgi:hypothetical protein